MIGFHWNGWQKHPEGRFQCVDPGLVAMECEYLELIYGLVRAHKPERILETGSGISTMVLLAACKANGRGHVTTVDLHPRVQPEHGLTIVEGDGVEYISGLDEFSGCVDFALLDSSEESKSEEAKLLLICERMSANGLVCLHDTGEKHHGNPPVDRFRSEVWSLMFGHDAIDLAKGRGLTIIQAP